MRKFAAWVLLFGLCVGLVFLFSGCAPARRVWIDLQPGPPAVTQTPTLYDGIPRCRINFSGGSYAEFGRLFGQCLEMRP